jgi:hypothetical protein
MRGEEPVVKSCPWAVRTRWPDDEEVKSWNDGGMTEETLKFEDRREVPTDRPSTSKDRRRFQQSQDHIKNDFRRTDSVVRMSELNRPPTEVAE